MEIAPTNKRRGKLNNKESKQRVVSLRPLHTPHIFKCLIDWSGTRKGTLLHLAESRGQFKHVDTDQETLSWPSYSTTIEHHTLKYFKIPVSTDSHPLWQVKKFSWLGSWRPEAIFHFWLYLSVQVPRWRKGSFCPVCRGSTAALCPFTSYVHP